MLKGTKEPLSQKRWLFPGAKPRYEHLLGNAEAGNRASVAVRWWQIFRGNIQLDYCVHSCDLFVLNAE